MSERSPTDEKALKRGTLLFASLTSPIAGMLGGVFLWVIGAALFRTITDGWQAAPPQSAILILTTPVMVMLGAIYYGALIGVPAMLLFGMPGHALLLRFNLRALYWYAAIGVVIAFAVYLLCVAALMTWMPAENDEVLLEGGNIALALCIGMMTASCFWLIRRPDRDPPNPTTPAP